MLNYKISNSQKKIKSIIKILNRDHIYLLKIFKLTRNVNKDHLNEIFSVYGNILNIDFPIDKLSKNHKGVASIQ